MDGYDVIVMGIDPALDRRSVIAAVAARLSAPENDVAALVSEAPTTLVANVSEADARQLVVDLRKLGVRVKPRAAGQALESLPPAPASMPAPAHHASGLELDLPLPAPRAPSVAPRPEPVRSRPQPDAPPPKLVEVQETPERPRAFWTALPEALAVPFRGPALYGLLGAPCLAVTSMFVGVVGTRISLMGGLVALVLAFGYVGAMLQLARRCLWAAAVGERVADPLPSDLMSDYMFPGIGVLVAQGALGGVSLWLAFQLDAHGAPPAALLALWIFVGLYGVIGFALSAANASAMGYLDVLRILRILVKAPLHVATIAILGALVQGAAWYGAFRQLYAAMETGEIGTIFVSVGLVGFLITFAATYGAALTATMMGMLFYAKPEVAG